MKNSYWIETTEKKQTFSSIEQDTHANIVIVGAGLTGLSTAYYLSKVTTDVLILEADEVGYGASGRNTGKVTSQHGLIYNELLHNYDRVIAKQYYLANEEALTSIEEIIKQNGIDCDFNRCNSMIYTNDPTMVAKLQDEYQAYLDLEIPCAYVTQTKYPFDIKAGIVMKQQAKFNPYAYALGLSDIVHKAGISIYEHSPVETMIEEDGHYTLWVNKHKVHANKVIFASQFPFIDHGHFYFTRMYCMQESIVCGKGNETLPNDMLLNIEKPLHSYNPYTNQILVGGNSYKSGQKNEVSDEAFRHHALKTFHLESIDYEWSSQDYISFDKMPYIGMLDKQNENLLFASGYSKWGNTSSNVAGKLLCAYAIGQNSQYRMIFSPQRFSSIFSLPFVKENMNVAYEFIKGKFKHGDDSYPAIKHAKVMQIDGHNYGVYRDEHEELFIVDITCPHLGCVCNFNHVDKTWDCPCHGSRYSYTGAIIKGPTTKPLQPYGEGLNKINPHLKK